MSVNANEMKRSSCFCIVLERARKDLVMVRNLLGYDDSPVTIQGPRWAFCGGVFVGKRRMVVFLSEWSSLECQNQYLIKAELDRNNK